MLLLRPATSSRMLLPSAAFLGASAAASALLRTRRALRTAPPVAKRVPHKVAIGKVPGEERGPGAMDPPVEVEDDLFWLRDDDRKRRDVLDHLEAENGYTQLATAGLPVEPLYRELLSRVKETDADVPYRWGEWLYYNRTEAG